MTPVIARVDPRLRAQVLERRPLVYRGPRLDGAVHVRAASGICWFGGRLLIAQDDALVVARLDRGTGALDAIELPVDAGAERFFDADRGNKELKADLEACVAVPYRGATAVLALGSGSSPSRERLFLLENIDTATARVRRVDAGVLYAALRAAPWFASSELNVEGAVWSDGRLRLFQRSNGLVPDAGSASCATCDLDWPAFERFLDAPTPDNVPAVERVTRYDLGRMGQARLTFTDAAALPEGRALFLASAERSPNAVDDGEIQGSAIGWLDAGTASLCPLLDEQGELVKDKAEGIAVWPDDATRAYVVFDPDDHRQPATLAVVALTSFPTQSE